MDIRFLAKMHETWTPTTHQQARDLTQHLIDVVEGHTVINGKCPTEGAIAGLYAAFIQICEDNGYDAIGVAEILLAKDSRLPPMPTHEAPSMPQ